MSNTKINDEKLIEKRLSSKIINSLLIKEDNIYYPNIDFINKFKEYIEINNKFLCKLTEKGKYIARGKWGKAYLLEDKYVIKKLNNVKIPDFLTFTSYNIDQYVNEDLNSFYYKKKGIDKKCILIATSKELFINQTCIHLILNEIFTKIFKCNNYVYQYTAFYCSSTSSESKSISHSMSNAISGKGAGLNITEYCNQGDLSDYLNKPDIIITDDLLKDIVFQVLTPLSILKCKEFEFSHADLKCKNIFVTKQGNKIIYKLGDYDKCSIFWNGIRFCVSHSLSKTFDIIKPNIKIDNNIEYYYLNKVISVYSMFGLSPMYISYDIYVFMYSLLREKKVTEAFLNNKIPFFTKLLNIIFYEDDLNNIKNHLIKQKNNNFNYSSLTLITNEITKLNIKLKVNIDELYNTLNIVSTSKINKFIKNGEKRYINISDNNQICSSKCIDNICNTPHYSKFNLFGKNKVYSKAPCGGSS
jgi:hypothetical protein